MSSRTKMIWPLLVTGTVLLYTQPSLAVPADTTDARKIMDAVFNRDMGDKMTSRMTMTIEAGRKRVRTLQYKAMKFDGGTKYLMIFESPADVRNTALLSLDHDDGNKDDDQWLYLPSLRKSTRISTGEKSGSFMGSDFTYSDMTKQATDQYDFQIVQQSVKIDGEDCWLIEARPRTDKAKNETGYVKSHIWVSKQKLMALQLKAWVRQGKKIKYVKFQDIKKVDGIWVAHTAAVRTTKGDSVLSTTTLQFSNVKFNDPGIQDADFTQGRLAQGL